MAKVCQVTGKRANNAKHIKHQHSQGWMYKAPKKNRVQDANLQIVHLKTPNGKIKLKISTKAMKSPDYAAVVCGLKPIPASWRKKPTY